jgi:hypothetical protein
VAYGALKNRHIFFGIVTVVTAAQFRPNKKASEAAVASPIEL